MTDTIDDDWPGCLYARDLGNGVGLWVVEMIYNDRIVVGPIGALTVDDAWCYDKGGSAVEAAIEWDPAVCKEPSGWKKHPRTGRYRPDGDPERQEIQ